MTISGGKFRSNDGVITYSASRDLTVTGGYFNEKATGNPGTPGDDGEQQPLGDALLPLMLFTALYLLYITKRKRLLRVASF